jgi:hypothetical protein
VRMIADVIDPAFDFAEDVAAIEPLDADGLA